MKSKLVLSACLLVALLAPSARAEESPAEKTAREWFLAVLQGHRDKVTKLTRVPFAVGNNLIPTQQLMEEYVFSAIGRDDAVRKKAADLTVEAIKAKTLEKYTSSSALKTQLMDHVAAHHFVEVSIGDTTVVLYLTKGVKPKVVGFSK